MADRAILAVVGFLLVVPVWVGLSQATGPAYQPTYSARYTATEDGLLRDILGELRGIRSEIQALRRQGAQAKPVANLQELFAARCASCHAEAIADKKGAGFVLLTKDGKVPPLSLAEKKRIVRMVGRGEMPPTLPFTDEEKEVLQGFLYPKED